MKEGTYNRFELPLVVSQVDLLNPLLMLSYPIVSIQDSISSMQYRQRSNF